MIRFKGNTLCSASFYRFPGGFFTVKMVVLTLLFLTATSSLKAQCDPHVSISTPISSICQGSTVTFTATPLNSGVTPSFQWKVNDVNTGPNSAVFTSSTLNNNDRISVDLTPDPATCPTGPVVSSNTITMTVNDTRTPLVTISELPNPVCAGNPVTFTATEIIEGGVSPVFQWQVNGINTGDPSGSPVFLATLNDNDQVRVLMNSSVGCAINPAISNSITINVNPTPVLTTSLEDKIYCNHELTVPIPLSGMPSPVLFNISGGSGIGLPDQTSVSAIPAFTAITGTATIMVVPVANNCTGTPATFIITVHPDPLVDPPADLTFCNGSLTSPQPLSGTPSGVVFDISGGSAIGLADRTGLTAIPSFTTVTGIAEITVVPKANGCTGTPVHFNITVHPNPSSNTPADQTYCNNVLTTPIALSGTPTGVLFNVSGGSAIGLADQTAVSVIPAFLTNTGNAVITLTPAANNCIGNAVQFNITVNPTPVSNPVSNQTYCSGASTLPIQLTGTPSGVLFDISGGTSVGLPDQNGVNSIPVFTAAEGNATVRVTPRANGCTGSPVFFTVRVDPNLPVSVSIS
ncbi:MAG: hypothetical protein ACM3UT_04155, partial [Chloroflexota bacterium]